MGKKKVIPHILAILLVLFAFIWTVTARVNASNDSLDKVLNISQPGEYSAAFPKEPYQGAECNLTIANTSGSPMQLVIYRSINRTKVTTSDEVLKELGYAYTSPAEKEIVRYFAPGQTATFHLDFANDYGNGVSSTNLFKVTASQSTIRDMGGKTFADAQPVTGSVSGYLFSYEENPSLNARYFRLTVQKKWILKLDLTDTKQGTAVLLYNASDSAQTNKLLEIRAKAVTKSSTITLDPGTYVLKAISLNRGEPAVYTLNLGGREYIPATGVTITCSEKSLSVIKGDENDLHFTLSTVPANSDDKLQEILFNGKQVWSNIGENTFSYTLEWPSLETGYNTLQANTSNGVGSKKLEILVKPKAPVFSKTDVHTYYNAISFGRIDSNYQGDGIRLYMQNGKKWVVKGKGSSTKSFYVKKLKPNKTYKFKAVTYAKGRDGRIVESAPVYKTLKTARKNKVSVASIYAKNVRVTSDYAWIKEAGVYKLKKVYKTYYTLVINLNKKTPGARGLCVNDTIKAKGKTRFKISSSMNGNYKGSKIRVSLRAFSQKGTLGGYGPVVWKSVVLN